MKDIDFDELDRAVSSVLEPVADAKPTTAAAGTTPSVPQPQPAAPETTSVPDVAPTTPESIPTTPVTTDPVTPPAAATKTPLAIKRRGQFMDVVHPSSDMTSKSEETAVTPPRKVTLQPLSTSVTPEADSPTATPEADEATVSEPAAPVAMETPVVELQAPAETVEPAPTEHAMPDPLDVMQTHEEANDAASTEASTIEDVPVNASDAVEDMPAEAATETTPTTPFLTDTKVDKRPLDAFSADEGEAPAELTSDSTAATEPLPPELQADVIAVEANPSDHMESTGEKEPVADDKKEEGTGFNASIPQQYASSDGKPDEDHSIFDTSEYHQPLAPVKPKKRGLPGWLTAFLIMILLAGLSAAGGYFWFYYGL